MAIICIDPGHCDKFTGAGKGTQREEKDTLKLSLKVERYLKSYGHSVYLTRRSDDPIDNRNGNADLNARPAFANKIKADYFISIHRNSHSNTTARGNEIWVHSKADNATEKIAQHILDNVNEIADTPNRGLKKGYTGGKGDYAINRLSNMPSALLELGFISNDIDNVIFNANIDGYAEAIAQGICQGMGIAATPPAPRPAPSSYFQVRVFDFANKASANSAAEKIKKLGYYCQVESKQKKG